MAKEIYDSEIGYGWKSYLPAIVAVVGAFIMLGLRLTLSDRFITDGALMMLALACYIFAALFQLTNGLHGLDARANLDDAIVGAKVRAKVALDRVQHFGIVIDRENDRFLHAA